MKKIRRLIFIFIAIAMLVTLVGCGNEEETNTRKKNSVENEVNNTKQTETPEYESDENPVATMVVEYVDESGNKEEGTIKIELYPDKAPITVANFINLANNKFYDGLTFHRIVDKFMIQGGDPKGNGTGGASLSDLNKNVQKGSSEDYNYSIKGEFSKNNISNKIKFEAGTIAMARSDYSSLGLAEDGYNSACSQFFIIFFVWIYYQVFYKELMMLDHLIFLLSDWKYKYYLRASVLS